MTDNCNTMIGGKTGFMTKVRETYPNVVEFTGCRSHLSNLLQKSEVNIFDTYNDIIRFCEAFSTFIVQSPNAQSVLKQIKLRGI